MRSRFVPLVLIAGLGVACRSGADAEKTSAPPTQTAAVPAKPAKEESKATAALPIIPPKAPAPEAKPAGTPADARVDRLAALIKEQADAMNAYYEAIQAALGDNENPSAEDWKKVQEKVKEPDAAGYLARAQALLDEDKTDLTAFKTIEWLLNNQREPGTQKPLLALLEQYHMDRPEMGDLCNMFSQKEPAMLEKLCAKSPHLEVRGRACYAMAEGLKNDIQTAGYLEGKSEQELGGMKEYLGEEKLAKLQKLDVAATQKEMEKIYDRVLTEFADIKLNAGTKRETTLGKQASGALHELRDLAVGKTTPEIEGVDLDSVAFKLSDYRGKVVLLDFWGNW